MFIVGTGGFAQEVLSIIDDLGLYDNFKGFIEPDHIWETLDTKVLMGSPIIKFSDIEEGSEVYIGVANPKIRKLTTEQLPKCIYPTLIHPRAIVSRWSKIGPGAIIAAGCIISTNVTIGSFCSINLNTTIGHDCVIKDFFTTAPGVCISGNCKIGSEVYFGTGAMTKQGITICSNTNIGMNTVIINDIVVPGQYVGIARVLPIPNNNDS